MCETRTHDLQGQPYAKLSQLKAGDKVRLDGFECASGTVEVHAHKDGALYFGCREGAHLLEAQCEPDDDTLVGIYPT